MRRMFAMLAVSLAFSAAAHAQQFGTDQPGAIPFSAEPPPFSVSATPCRTTGPADGKIRVCLVLGAAPNHKIYRSSVTVSLHSSEVYELAGVDIPPGVVAASEPNTPAGEAVFKGKTTIMVTLGLKKPLSPRDMQEHWAADFDVEYRGCSDKVCFPPEKTTVHARIRPSDSDLADWPPVGATQITYPQNVPAADNLTLEDLKILAAQTAKAQNLNEQIQAHGHVLALIFSFASGFLVSLTPCVWPLIPIILAVVGAGAEGSGWRRGLGLSLVYVIGIACVYAVLGAGAGALGRSVQGITQSPWLIGVVCLAFVALALSMFGLYDIRVPSSVAGKLQGRRGTGIAGVFIMGLVSGLVASPCVSAPLLGLFAGIATLGSIWVGALAGFAFALGMGIILIVAGTSSKALASLPHSGEWMVSIKHFFGWVMLGAAVWFSEMALGPVVFRVLMLALLAAAILAAAWSMGARPGASRLSKLLLLALILVLCAGLVYFALGLSSEAGTPGIAWSGGLDDGLAFARSAGKPAFIDVTADWCSYCKEVDREVFSMGDFAAESRRFVMIRLDVTVQTPAVADAYKRFGIVGPPAFVFIPSTGSPVTVNGKRDHDTILQLMKATR